MRTIRLNDSGEEVRRLQHLLNEQKIRVVMNGVFDGETQDVVVCFQKENGLDADGIVGYATWETLLLPERKKDEKLTDEDFVLVAELLEVEPMALRAVQEVETGGKGGFFAPGKPALLFEGHIFWSQLKKKGLNPEQLLAGNENILYPKWEKGHYKGGLAEYDRLEQARKIHREAADASASWGMFQMMGFNFAACGEKSVESFVKAMCESELLQLVLSARFIRKGGMLPFLQAKDWTNFAKRYNGPAYAQNRYDEKLANAYRKWRG